MKRKILILGRSGSGKDTLAIALTQEFGMKQLCSTTTRPKRYENEDAHIFVSEEEANKMKERVAETIINGYQYFATKQQLEECDTYVVDPRGLECLCNNAPDIPFCIVYVRADDEIRKNRAMNRAENPEEAAIIFDNRQADEDEMFSEFETYVYGSHHMMLEKYPNINVIITLENNHNDKEIMTHFAKLVESAAKSEDGAVYRW